MRTEIKAQSQETSRSGGYYKTILPVFIIGVTLIYFLRFFIIKLLFTVDFLPVESLFLGQLLGDVFKVCSLILGFQFLAKKMTVAFIISELISLAVLYFSSIYFIRIFGIEGVVIAQAFDNFLYLILLFVYFRKNLV